MKMVELVPSRARVPEVSRVLAAAGVTEGALSQECKTGLTNKNKLM